MEDIRNLEYRELKDLVASFAEKPYRASQLYLWLFNQRAVSFDEMTDIPKGFRQRLKERFYISHPKIAAIEVSRDGATKLLLELDDKNYIESVIIPEEKRTALCISSQVGCPLACKFCMTGSKGFIRNLRLSEIINQVFAAERHIQLQSNRKITNLVLMGMGEPLLNLEEVTKFLNIAADQSGLAFAPRKITVSTAGIAPGIERLSSGAMFNLAISLNATTDEVRSRLMPINKRYPLKVVLDACRRYQRSRKRAITFEYVLIKDINDSLEDAHRLITMLKGIECKINLIPFNTFPGTSFNKPERGVILEFQKVLLNGGYAVFIRESRGDDISAACGQLRGKLVD
ncbi:MAG: 23S rRNA (adenine(2503)-C(2))-methyltransferase RlmN [Thermodesulfobacteriota bacterium]